MGLRLMKNLICLMKEDEKTLNNILTEKYISSANGKTYYWISKNESELTLVFLPGLTANHTLFEKQVIYFGDKYDILVWDCPCHGKSRPYNDFTYAKVAKELNTILTTEGIKSVVIIGQSLGGMIGQYFIDSYRDKIKGFIAIDSAPFGDYYTKSDFFWLNQLEWMCKLFPDKMLRKSMAWLCATTYDARKRMEKMLDDYSKKELCHLMYIGEAAFIPENKNIHLRCKSLLILGEKDRVGKVTSYNKEWSKRTGYPLMVIRNAAHNSNDDNPEEVNKIIENYLMSLT